MKAAKIILKNSFFLIFGTVVSKGVTFIYIAFIARSLGIEAFGKYSFALSLVMMFSMLSDLGLSVFIFREISRNKKQISNYVGNVLIMRIVTGICFLVIINCISIFSHYDSEKKMLIFILSFWILILNLSQVFRATFKAMEKMAYEAWAEVLDNVLRLVFVIFLIKFGFGVVGVAFSLLAASIVTIIFSINVFLKKFASFKFDLDFRIWREAIKQVFPLSLAAVLITYFGRIDNLILAYFKGDAAVGLYDSSCRLVWMIIFIPAYLTQSTFPKLSEAAIQCPRRFSKLLTYLIKFNFIVTIPMTLVMFIFSSLIIHIIYGASFSSSTSILKVLIWSYPIHAVIGALVYALYAMNKQHINSIFITIALIVNVILDITFVGKFSYFGIAYSTLSSLILLCLLLFQYAFKNGYFELKSLCFTKEDFLLGKNTLVQLFSKVSREELK
ncbi:MAG: flippase [Nanoarchaeota archaeon]